MTASFSPNTVTAAASEKNPATPILWPIIGPTGQPVTSPTRWPKGTRGSERTIRITARYGSTTAASTG